MSEQGTEFIADLFPLFKVSTTYNPAIVKIRYVLHPLCERRTEGHDNHSTMLTVAVRMQLHAFLTKKQEFKKKTGAAPKGEPERVVQRALIRNKGRMSSRSSINFVPLLGLPCLMLLLWSVECSLNLGSP